MFKLKTMSGLIYLYLIDFRIKFFFISAFKMAVRKLQDSFAKISMVQTLFSTANRLLQL